MAMQIPLPLSDEDGPRARLIVPADFAADKSHPYLWTPNALVADGTPFTDGESAFVAASLFLPSIAP